MRSALFVGGCHVGGYLVGMDYSFTSKTLNADGLRSVFDYSDYSKPVGVSRALEFVKNRSDRISDDSVIVFQLGNFETSTSLIPDIFRKKKAVSPSAGSRVANTNPANTEVPPSASLIAGIGGSVVKIPLLFLYEALGKSRFNSEKFILQLHELSLWLNSNGPRNVIFLSTFCSLHPSLNFYRKQANKILKKFCEESGYVYVDVWTELRQGRKMFGYFASAPNFYDNEHLNARGHSVVASKLIEYLRSRI